MMIEEINYLNNLNDDSIIYFLSTFHNSSRTYIDICMLMYIYAVYMYIIHTQALSLDGGALTSSALIAVASLMIPSRQGTCQGVAGQFRETSEGLPVSFFFFTLI